jgi:hypothetical protein
MAQPVHSVLFDSNADSNAYYNQQAASGDNLQFYASSYGDSYNSSSSYYGNAPPGPPPNMQSGNNFDYGRASGSFWSAFGTGGFDDEPPLLEELGINFLHIRAKVRDPIQAGQSHNTHSNCDAIEYGSIESF